jgi:hypothetical protein
MSWALRLDDLNSALNHVKILAHHTTDEFHCISIDEVSLLEQIEIIEWFKNGGAWSTWDKGAPPNKKSDTYYHLLLRKGNIELNAGCIVVTSKNELKKKDWKSELIDCYNLNRGDDSLLYYTLSVIPFDGHLGNLVAQRVSEIKPVLLSKMLMMKKTNE